jgi:hypothetical protein
MNDTALRLFRLQVGPLWHRALPRRSQNGRVPGFGCTDLSPPGCLQFASIILLLIPCAAWASSPKVRAGWGKARPESAEPFMTNHDTPLRPSQTLVIGATKLTQVGGADAFTTLRESERKFLQVKGYGSSQHSRAN